VNTLFFLFAFYKAGPSLWSKVNNKTRYICAMVSYFSLSIYFALEWLTKITND
jgi:hypothetical protein